MACIAEVVGLQEAMKTRATIEQAKGMLVVHGIAQIVRSRCSSNNRRCAMCGVVGRSSPRSWAPWRGVTRGGTA